MSLQLNDIFLESLLNKKKKTKKELFHNLLAY